MPTKIPDGRPKDMKGSGMARGKNRLQGKRGLLLGKSQGAKGKKGRTGMKTA